MLIPSPELGSVMVLTRWEPQLNGNRSALNDIHQWIRDIVLTRWEPQLSGKNRTA
ncbi:hypothetical protein [Leptolyngbya boryana]